MHQVTLPPLPHGADTTTFWYLLDQTGDIVCLAPGGLKFGVALGACSPEAGTMRDRDACQRPDGDILRHSFPVERGSGVASDYALAAYGDADIILRWIGWCADSAREG